MKTLKILGSLKITVPVLVTMVGILIAATWTSGYDVSIGALRRDFYGSWWFNILLGVLMVNLVACTLYRRPWRFWQWGFLLTHTGVLVVMVGAAVTFNWKIYGDMAIQEGSSASDFELEGERELIVRTEDGREERKPVTVNPYVRSRPRTGWRMSSGLALLLEEYLPHSSDRVAYESVPGGRFDVVHLRTYLDGKPLEELHLRSGESVGNGLISFQYAGPADRLYENLASESSGRGTLVIGLAGESREIEVEAHLGKPVTVSGHEVTIRQFFSSFTIAEGGPQENPDQPDANPAVIFEVAAPGQPAETYFAFAFRPDISPMRRGGGMHGEGVSKLKASFRYTPRQSIVRIFSAPQGFRYVINTVSGRSSNGAFGTGEKVRHPVMPIPLTFEVVRRIESAEPTLLEEKPQKGRPVRPAVRLRVRDAKETSPLWIRFGEFVHVDTPKGPAVIQFAPRRFDDLGLSVELVKFRNPPHEGTGRPSKFESDLRIRDDVSSRVIEGKTSVNVPFSHRGWSFYQSAYNDKVTPVVSILQVSYDPGKRILYLGFLMTAFGTMFMILMRRPLRDLATVVPSAMDPSMRSATWIAFLALICIGPIAGALAILARPDLDGLLVGALIAAAGIAVPLAVAARASQLRKSRPRRARQLGQAVAAGWCLNAASLVVLMITRVS